VRQFEIPFINDGKREKGRFGQAIALVKKEDKEVYLIENTNHNEKTPMIVQTGTKAYKCCSMVVRGFLYPQLFAIMHDPTQ
jgi:hypothetical protein